MCIPYRPFCVTHDRGGGYREKSFFLYGRRARNPSSKTRFLQSARQFWRCNYGRLFWGRIAWDLTCGGVCAGLGVGMLLKAGGEFYEKMGLPQESLEIMQRLDLFHDPRVLLLWGLVIIGFLGFMIYTKRFFNTSAR